MVLKITKLNKNMRKPKKFQASKGWLWFWIFAFLPVAIFYYFFNYE